MLLKLPDGTLVSVASIAGVGIVKPFRRVHLDPEKGRAVREGWKFLYGVESRDYTVEGTVEAEVQRARDFMAAVLIEYHQGTPERGVSENPVREMPPLTSLATDSLKPS